MKRVIRILLFLAVLLLIFMCVISIQRGITSSQFDDGQKANPVKNENRIP